MMTLVPDNKNAQYAFDTLAATYDADFTASPVAQFLRDRVHQRLLSHFQAGQHVLEMGCGTGEDALFLAQAGILVTATDASTGMLSAARVKTQHETRVKLTSLDLNGLSQDDPLLNQQFDGAFANFGVLNCLSEWQFLASWLAQRIKTGGMLGFAIMPPFCLWEMLWHGIHGDFKTAFRRWRGSTFQPDTDSLPMQITYPTVRRMTRAFTPYFIRTSVVPLGLFLPPSDIYGIIEARPTIFTLLRRLEQFTGSISPLALFADHYWIELRRR